jgi:hypothetical protein
MAATRSLAQPAAAAAAVVVVEYHPILLFPTTVGLPH